MQPHVIMRVRTANGKLLYARRNASFGRVIEPQYVAMMNDMMQETLLTGTARKAELPGWQAAGKTGTSQDWRDAWFVGYTSYLVAAVWLGNDDDSPTKKVSGGNLPVEVWSRFMKAAHEGVPVAALPLANWRTATAPNPFAPLLPPLDLGGGAGAAPPSGGRGGGRAPPVATGAAAAPAPLSLSPRRRAAPAPAIVDAPRPARADPQRRRPAGAADQQLPRQDFRHAVRHARGARLASQGTLPNGVRYSQTSRRWGPPLPQLCYWQTGRGGPRATPRRAKRRVRRPLSAD